MSGLETESRLSSCHPQSYPKSYFDSFVFAICFNFFKGFMYPSALGWLTTCYAETDGLELLILLAPLLGLWDYRHGPPHPLLCPAGN